MSVKHDIFFTSAIIALHSSQHTVPETIRYGMLEVVRISRIGLHSLNQD